MKINKIYLAFCIAAIALFFVGRCSGPKAVVIDNKHTIDSLTISAKASHNRALMAEERAHKAFQKGVDAQKVKVVIRTIYRNDTSKNHSYTPGKKDTLIKEMFHVKINDSSKFSTPVANGILDLRSENTMLKSNAALDSVSLMAKDEGIQELGYALNEMTASGEAKNGLVLEEREINKKLRKEIRRQKFFKWLAFGGLAIVTTLAISKN